MKTFLLVFAASVIGSSAVFGQAAVEKKAAASGASAKAAEPKNVTPDEAEKLIKANPKTLIIDVRTPEEFATGHIAGATNVDVSDPDFEKKIAALAQGEPVIVHCRAGRRGAKALPTFSKQKFPAIYHMNDGLNAWKAAGKPVTK